MNRYLLYVILVIVSLWFGSCVINKHYYEYYDSCIPNINDFPNKVPFEKYEKYFVKDVYCFLDCTSTDKYPAKIRWTKPFVPHLYCITKNDSYEIISFTKIKISSNLGCKYENQNDISLNIDYYYTAKNETKIYSTYLESGSQKWNSYNFKFDENEVITVSMDAILYDREGNNFSKTLTYTLYPKTKVEYLDLITDLF